jgi:hypothetical protein
MRILFRRLITVGLATLALAPALAGGVSPAAAATTIYVDDTAANNNGVACPSPVGTTIQQGVNAAPTSNATINVCPGSYTAGATISNKPNLKLIAKGTVKVTAPAGYGLTLFQVDTNSTNVTIQGFIIDGGSNLNAAGGGAVAIGFYGGSSGSILKNTIVHWHQPNLATANAHTPIYAQNSGVMKIDHNTIYDFSGNGIWLLANTAPPIISRNLVIVTSDGGFSPNGILVQGITGGAITSNTIRSDRNFHNAAAGSVGIALTDSANVKVKGNNIIAVLIGLWVSGECAYTPHASGNQLTGNKLYDNNTGISITAVHSTCAPFADGNKVTGNTIFSDGLDGTNGINGVNIGVGATNTIGSNATNKVLPAPPSGF